MNIFRMKLQNEPYLNILKGKKNIEIRLNDEKRKNIKNGDLILFVNKDDKYSQFVVKVLDLIIAPDFKKLFSDIGNPEKCGWDKDAKYDEMAEDMRKIYSKENEEKYGALGIKISKPLCEIIFPLNLDESMITDIAICPIIGGERLVLKDNKILRKKRESSFDMKDDAIRFLKDELKFTINYKDIFKFIDCSVIKDGVRENIRFYTANIYNKIEFLWLQTVNLKYIKKAVNDKLNNLYLPKNCEYSDIPVINSLSLLSFDYYNDNMSTDFKKAIEYENPDVFIDYYNIDGEDFAEYVLFSDILPFNDYINKIKINEHNISEMKEILKKSEVIELLYYVKDNLSDEEFFRYGFNRDNTFGNEIFKGMFKEFTEKLKKTFMYPVGNFHFTVKYDNLTAVKIFGNMYELFNFLVKNKKQNPGDKTEIKFEKYDDKDNLICSFYMDKNYEIDLKSVIIKKSIES